MKKTLILFPLISIFVLIPVRGQEPCTETALAQKPGLIRESKLRGSTPGLTPAEVARARATLTKIHQTIAAGYKPVGLVGDYSYHFSGGTTASTFGYSMYLLKYNCDPSSGDRTKFYIGTDTPTVVRIDANTINPLNFSASDYNDNTFRGYFFIRKLPQKVDGFYYLGGCETSGRTAQFGFANKAGLLRKSRIRTRLLSAGCYQSGDQDKWKKYESFFHG